MNTWQSPFFNVSLLDGQSLNTGSTAPEDYTMLTCTTCHASFATLGEFDDHQHEPIGINYAVNPNGWAATWTADDTNRALALAGSRIA